MKELDRYNGLLAALVVAIGLSSAGFFVSKTLYNSKVSINTAEVKGLAERRVEADRAFWTIEYSVSGGEDVTKSVLYNRSERDKVRIIRALIENGFNESEISPGVVRFVEKEYRDEDQNLVEVRYQIRGYVGVETDQVLLVSNARSKMNELIAEGLDIRNHAPAYHFTRLNEIKPEMLQEATRNARLAAEEFAANASVKVGGIREARQGRFSIRDVGNSSGDTKKIKKDVRVVTAITFYLE